MAYKKPERRHYYDRKVGGTVYEIVGSKFHRKVQTLEGFLLRRVSIIH